MSSTVSKALVFLFVPLFLFSCKASKVFNKGSVELPTIPYTIPIHFVNKLPLVNVHINGKDYVFLLDTGAPTVISRKIYDDLGIKPYVRQKVTDSQRTTHKQDFVVIPEMWVDSLKFREIGAVVMDMEAMEFFCHAIDGIVGANQMAKLAWKINYDEGVAVVSQDFSALSFAAYDHKVSFRTEHQKTPHIRMSFDGISKLLIFDTGFNGYLNINDVDGRLFDRVPTHQKYSLYGMGSVGIYGAGKRDTVWQYVLDEIDLDGVPIQKVFARTAPKNLLGNNFLKQYEFALDWENSHIYFKRISPPEGKLTGYGFGYRFVDNVPTVILVSHNPEQVLEIGDVILSMNGVSLENLSDDEVCTYLVNRIENQSDTVHLTVERGGAMKEFTVVKKVLLQ